MKSHKQGEGEKAWTGLGAGSKSLEGLCLKPSVHPLHYVDVQTGPERFCDIPKVTLPDSERASLERSA